MTMTYKMPDFLAPPRDRFEVAAAIGFFLQENGLGLWDRWEGRMSADDQRHLFGVKLGKGRIAIDGDTETVTHYYKTCYGQNREASVYLDCKSGVIGRNFWSHTPSAHERELDAAADWFHA